MLKVVVSMCRLDGTLKDKVRSLDLISQLINFLQDSIEQMATDSVYCPAVVSEAIETLSHMIENNADNQWHVIS